MKEIHEQTLISHDHRDLLWKQRKYYYFFPSWEVSTRVEINTQSACLIEEVRETGFLKSAITGGFYYNYIKFGRFFVRWSSSLFQWQMESRTGSILTTWTTAHKYHRLERIVEPRANLVVNGLGVLFW